MKIRQTVFVEEQGFRDEFDEIDARAVHFVLFDRENPVAVCRVFESTQPKIYILGRLAVLKEHRRKHLGRFLVEQAELFVRSMGAKELRLHSQCAAAEFYRKQGFAEFGAVDYEENCPHVWMQKTF